MSPYFENCFKSENMHNLTKIMHRISDSNYKNSITKEGYDHTMPTPNTTLVERLIALLYRFSIVLMTY